MQISKIKNIFKPLFSKTIIKWQAPKNYLSYTHKITGYTFFKTGVRSIFIKLLIVMLVFILLPITITSNSKLKFWTIIELLIFMLIMSLILSVFIEFIYNLRRVKVKIKETHISVGDGFDFTVFHFEDIASFLFEKVETDGNNKPLKFLCLNLKNSNYEIIPIQSGLEKDIKIALKNLGLTEKKA